MPLSKEDPPEQRGADPPIVCVCMCARACTYMHIKGTRAERFWIPESERIIRHFNLSRGKTMSIGVRRAILDTESTDH